MKDRPILFSAPMVRASLAGTKTQTRRAVKWKGLKPGLNLGFSGLRAVKNMGGFSLESDTRTSVEDRSAVTPCPYGQPGDRLWVRETHLIVGGADSKNPRVVYAATNDGPDAWLSPVWRPSIHMPRWASRITLEITSLRVERLRDISEADAAAEGLLYNTDHMGHWSGTGERWYSTAREAFRDLWQSINGPESWDTNPWVWVVEFKRMESA